MTKVDAELAAELWNPDRPLSLADRLCLGVGKRLGLPVATADRLWTDVTGGPVVVLIR